MRRRRKTAIRVLFALASAAVAAAVVAVARPATSSPQALVYEDGGWIFRARLDGTAPARLVRGKEPDLSPDGRWVAFSRSRQGHDPDLYLVRASGGGSPRLVRTGVEWHAWFPDSRRLVVDDVQGIAVVDGAGTRRQLAKRWTRDGWASYGTLAPDLAAVFFQRYRQETTRVGRVGRPDVFTVHTAGGAERRLTENGASSYPLAGRDAIAFARLSAPRSGIWVTDPAGKTKRRVLAGQGLRPVFWLPGGELVVYEARFIPAGPLRGRVWVVDTGNGRARAVTSLVDGLVPLALSRDGKSLLAKTGCEHYGVGHLSRGLLGTIPLAGGKLRVLVHGACSGDWNG